MIAAVVEAVVAAIAALIEAVASLFAAGAEALGIGELIALLFVVTAELIGWCLLGLWALIVALFRWRRPQRVARPRFWRPKGRRKTPR